MATSSRTRPSATADVDALHAVIGAWLDARGTPDLWGLLEDCHTHCMQPDYIVHIVDTLYAT